ncbi:beta-galactosidase small subunit [Streptomyces griseorubiginosus]|uniref:beta-galactosidase small subunit n=1 Tax=Streptomyces griseorubiginosus TaxID=67304 RepID=UPI00215A82EC|nr:beta-galactosidase small subunit [Streptomyces griseorubiginosus]
MKTSRPLHTTCLTPPDRAYVSLDVAQHGVGSGACGPRVRPRYERHAQPVSLTLGFRTC